MYIGRAAHGGDLIPGYVDCSNNLLSLPWGGRDHLKKEYEILVSNGKANYGWIRSSSGKVPQNAIPGGYTSTDEILYIGRKIHEGVMTLGKVQPSHGCLYTSYGGYEISHIYDYEVLVSRESIEVGLDVESLGETKGIDLFTIPRYTCLFK